MVIEGLVIGDGTQPQARGANREIAQSSNHHWSWHADWLQRGICDETGQRR